MSSPHNQIQKYQSVQVESASPEALVVLAYDALLKFLHTAKSRLAQHDIEQTHQALKRAQLIILELMAALKVDAWEGGMDLLRLYDYMLDRLQRANMEKNPEPIDEVLPIVQELRDAWQEAYRQLQAKRQGGQSGVSEKG